MKASERQKLKHDAYAETVMTGWDWARHHQVKLIAGVVAAVVIAGSLGWFLHTRQQEQRDADNLLTDLQYRASAALATKGDTRAEAIKEVLEKYDSLVKSFPDAAVAPLAVIQAAKLLSDADQPATAVEYYERAIKMAGARPELRMMALRGEAAALEKNKETAKAIEAYQALAAGSGSEAQSAAWANWDIGRCYETLKDMDKAKTHYQRTVELGGDSTWANLARFRLDALARGPVAEAPEIVAPTPAGTASVTATTASIPVLIAPATAVTASAPAMTASAPAMTAPAARPATATTSVESPAAK